MDYWIIYLFVKLDDIRSALEPNGGLVFSSIMLVLLIFGLKIITSEHDDEEACRDALRSRSFKLSVYAFVFSLVFTFIINIAIAFTPSTGQMAAIYLGGKATQSETAEILSRLPEKYAKIIESKADQWLAEQDIGEIVENAADKLIDNAEK